MTLTYDPDDTTARPISWWQEVGGEGPKPYESAAWTFTTLFVEETDESVTEDSLSYEDYTPSQEWWESLGDEGPKPYRHAAWTYTSLLVAETQELLPIPTSFFSVYDSGKFDRGELGFIIDSGYFESVRFDTYDEASFLGSERGVSVKRTISKLMVYDSRATGPGLLGTIPQPLGLLASDPEAGSSTVITDPSEDSLEVVRQTNENDDVPPGILLGSVSYETFNGVLTITDWEHLNWEDDASVLLGVKTLLSQVPDGITEVRVLDPPHAFWTSLGFTPDYKGDPYLHIHL